MSRLEQKKKTWNLLDLLEALLVVMAKKTRGRVPYDLPIFHQTLYILSCQAEYKRFFNRPKKLIWQQKTGFMFSEDIDSKIDVMLIGGVIWLGDCGGQEVLGLATRLVEDFAIRLRPLLSQRDLGKLEAMADALLRQLSAKSR